MTNESLYEGREQTLVKHRILQRYLRRFARIIGSWSDSITYIDCFAGPWMSRSDSHEDASFAIALNELRAARDDLARQNKEREPVKLRCFFLEKDKAAFERLCEYVDQISDVEIKRENSEFEESIDAIRNFIRSSKTSTFPFFFIDPTGWTGFRLNTIQPLLEMRPGEVLVNFMTEHIRRFIDSPDPATQESFVGLFGDNSFREHVGGLKYEERDDACVTKYMQAVQAKGRFPFASSAVVLHPEKDRSHFHLIYLTRKRRGIEVFKEAERKSMEDMEAARARAQQRKRFQKTKQKEMFLGDDVTSTHFDNLRDRYTSLAQATLREQLKSVGKIGYDVAWTNALRLPLVWESDLKGWIDDWCKSEMIQLRGLKPAQRVPQLDQHIELVWNRGSTP